MRRWKCNFLLQGSYMVTQNLEGRWVNEKSSKTKEKKVNCSKNSNFINHNAVSFEMTEDLE